MNTVERYDKFLTPVYPMIPIEIVRGLGTTLWDAQGNAYLDLTSAQGSTNLGHCSPAVNAAIVRQLSTLTNHYNSFYSPLRAELAERLAGVAPAGLERSFFCNSGTEAVEAAIKFARASTGRKKILAFSNAFHGRTMGALSATWRPEFREPFEPLLPGFSHVPFNDLDAAKKAISSETAAVILELVQGESGVIPATPEFVRGLADACRAHGALLIVDEVQTGFGRTGAMFACAHYHLSPDLLCLAKSMANGFPMGAVLSNAQVSIAKKQHGSTFGGNPVACAAALAVLDALHSDRLIENARDQGQYFLDRLRALNLPLVREVRGKGLMIGLELKQRPAPYLAALAKKHILALPAGVNVLRFLPPLGITRQQIDSVLDVLPEVLA